MFRMHLSWIVFLWVLLISWPAIATPFNPNSFVSIFSALEPSSTVTVSTSGTPTLSISGGPTFVGAIEQQDAGEPEVAVFTFGSIHVPAGITINVNGSRPVALLSQSSLTMNGTVNVNQSGGYPGGQSAYSNNAYIGTAGSGPGGAGPATPGTYTNGTGGGGGGFGGAGGDGGRYSSSSDYAIGIGGEAAGDLLATLEGGSGGGGGDYNNNSYNSGGTGGGALELGAIGSILMSGEITANGLDGNGSAGGGGSGGGVLMHGSSLELEFNQSKGQVEVNGGGYTSYGASGGGGRVAMQFPDFTVGEHDFSDFQANRGSCSTGSNKTCAEDGEILLSVDSTTVPDGSELNLVDGRFDGNITLRTDEYNVSSGGLLKLSGANDPLNNLALASGATVQIYNGASQSIGELSGSGDVELASNASLTLGASNTDSEFTGAITGSGELIKTGSGTVKLSGSNSYDGQTTVNEGALIVDTDTLPGVVVTNSSVIFDQAAFGTYDQDITGTGSLIKAGVGTLVLGGENRQAGGTTVAQGTLALQSGTLQEGDLTVLSTGRVENTSGLLNVANLNNSGTVIGPARVTGALSTTAGSEIRLSQGEALVAQGLGTHSNAGRIEVLGGEFESDGLLRNEASTGTIYARNALLRFDGGLENAGDVSLSFGTSDVMGSINNVSGGEIVVSGLSNASFVDDVVNNGRIHTGTGSNSVFFGTVSGAGNFSGSGLVLFEGGFQPGNSPGLVEFGGDLMLGDASVLTIELGGTVAGTEYDKFVVGGILSLSGTLDVELWGDYEPTIGDSFDIFDFGSLVGSFSSISLPSLSSGLEWDTTSLHTSGVLEVVVPEPTTALLVGLGLIGLGVRRKVK